MCVYVREIVWLAMSLSALSFGFSSLPMGLFNKEAGQKSSHGVDNTRVCLCVCVCAHLYLYVCCTCAGMQHSWVGPGVTNHLQHAGVQLMLDNAP